MRIHVQRHTPMMIEMLGLIDFNHTRCSAIFEYGVDAPPLA